MEARNEDDLMQDLFQSGISHDPSSLMTKDSYTAFGKEVSEVLYKG